MNEESPQSFPLPSPVLLIGTIVMADLIKAGIKVQQYGGDGLKKNFTVTTDKEVPEEIKSSIREYAENYGFTIKFLTPG